MDSDERQDTDEKDEEGLHKQYDVILCGTGLTQSILAAALARAGKSCLHLDGDDTYGELQAVWDHGKIKDLQCRCQKIPSPDDASTFSTDLDISFATNQLADLQFHSVSPETQGLPIGSLVMTSQGSGVISAREGGTKVTPLQIQVTLDTPVLKTPPSVSQEGLAESLETEEEAQPISTVPFEVPVEVDADDSTQVEAWLKSNHGVKAVLPEILRRSLFDASPMCIFAAGRAVEGLLNSNVADYLEFKSIDSILWYNKGVLERVPCSKNDVFQSKLLSPMDKRRLMKVLQLVMDFGVKNASSEDAEEGNVVAEDTAENELQSLNERHLNQGRSLARPQNKAVATNELEQLEKAIQDPNLTLHQYLQASFKLSPSLCEIIRYALALETTPQSLAKGMDSLSQHVQSLGRYGTTAFLTPMYGSGELSQSFCRSAAVFGATYLLRRTPLGVLHSSSESESMRVVVSADPFTPGSSPKAIGCTHVIAPRILISSSTPSSIRVLRRVSLLKGKLVPAVEQRHLLFLPPGTVSGHHHNIIHGMTCDDSTQICPSGYTVLHLTTTVLNDDCDFSILDKAAEMMLSKPTPDGTTARELYHATFSFAAPSTPDSAETEDYPPNAQFFEALGQTVTADRFFHQAQDIFAKICPDETTSFMSLSEELKAVIEERGVAHQDEDDEQAMLSSALEMIEDEKSDE